MLLFFLHYLFKCQFADHLDLEHPLRDFIERGMNLNEKGDSFHQQNVTNRFKYRAIIPVTITFTPTALTKYLNASFLDSLFESSHLEQAWEKVRHSSDYGALFGIAPYTLSNKNLNGLARVEALKSITQKIDGILDEHGGGNSMERRKNDDTQDWKEIKDFLNLNKTNSLKDKVRLFRARKLYKKLRVLETTVNETLSGLDVAVRLTGRLSKKEQKKDKCSGMGFETVVKDRNIVKGNKLNKGDQQKENSLNDGNTNLGTFDMSDSTELDDPTIFVNEIRVYGCLTEKEKQKSDFETKLLDMLYDKNGDEFLNGGKLAGLSNIDVNRSDKEDDSTATELIPSEKKVPFDMKKTLRETEPVPIQHSGGFQNGNSSNYDRRYSRKNQSMFDHQNQNRNGLNSENLENNHENNQINTFKPQPRIGFKSLNDYLDINNGIDIHSVKQQVPPTNVSFQDLLTNRDNREEMYQKGADDLINQENKLREEQQIIKDQIDQIKFENKVNNERKRMYENEPNFFRYFTGKQDELNKLIKDKIALEEEYQSYENKKPIDFETYRPNYGHLGNERDYGPETYYFSDPNYEYSTDPNYEYFYDPKYEYFTDPNYEYHYEEPSEYYPNDEETIPYEQQFIGFEPVDRINEPTLYYAGTPTLSKSDLNLKLEESIRVHPLDKCRTRVGIRFIEFVDRKKDATSNLKSSDRVSSIFDGTRESSSNKKNSTEDAKKALSLVNFETLRINNMTNSSNLYPEQVDLFAVPPQMYEIQLFHAISRVITRNRVKDLIKENIKREVRKYVHECVHTFEQVKISGRRKEFKTQIREKKDDRNKIQGFKKKSVPKADDTHGHIYQYGEYRRYGMM